MDRTSLKSYPALAPTDEGALDPNSSYAHILQFVSGPKRVVDFGCGPGNLARFLSQRGCTVVGVEINPESAVLAKEYCEDVIIADLDVASVLKLFPSDRFDIAIFADILEHLREPWRLLKESHQILRAGGFVTASIPNIAHGAIRLSMLKGDFDYQELGVMDNTHLRFFTRKTVEGLFEHAGFAIDEMSRTVAPVFEPSELVPIVRKADFPDNVVLNIQRDPEAVTLQFVVKAVPVTSAKARDASLKRKNATLQARITDMEQEVQRLQSELLHARADVTTSVGESETRFEAERATWTQHRLELNEQIRLLKAELARVEAEYVNHERASQEGETVRAGLQTELSSLKTEVARFEAERQVQEQTAREWDTARGELHEQIRVLKDEVARVEAERKTHERAREELVAYRIRLEDQLESAQSHVGNVSAELSSALFALEDHKNQVAGLRSELDISRRNLAHSKEDVAHQGMLRDVVATNNRELAAELVALRWSRSELEEANRAIADRERQSTEQNEQERAALRAQVVTLSEDRQALSAEIARLANLETELRERILERQSANDQVTAERDRLFSEKQAELDAARERLESTRATLKMTHYEMVKAQEGFEAAEERRRAEVQEATRALTATDRELLRTQEAYRIAEGRIGDLQSILSDADERGRESRQEMERLSAELDARRHEVDEIRERLIAATTELDEERAAGEGWSEAFLELEERFIAQAEAITAKTRAEIDEVSAQVEAIRSSPFWSVKLAVAGVKPALAKFLRMFSAQPTR
jgi:2-polyprenyl-3-methyl-5-hydroxy-6-metoxy-1,4-benzoquinol methylase/predicted  nucleic acid-binding Zn-ribbon protein